MSSQLYEDKIAGVITIQQINLREVEALKLDREEANGSLSDERFSKSLDNLISNSVKTSLVLQELADMSSESDKNISYD
jgi:hypothetical protein